MICRQVLSLVIGSVLGVSLLSAGTITVHNTGVNGSDVVQAIGAATNFWTLFSEPVGASEAIGSTPFRFIVGGSYYPDNALSGWVSPGSNGFAGVSGNYVYQLMVDLTGFDPATAVITGTFGTDNDGAISLNGNAAVATTGFAGFGAATGFTLNSGFVSGQNFIRVTMDNGGDPTAFRVEFSSATANPVSQSGVPEPGTLGLLGFGVTALVLIRRRV